MRTDGWDDFQQGVHDGLWPDCRVGVRMAHSHSSSHVRNIERASAARIILWLHHGHDVPYSHDGEMQCSQYPPADFKRDPIDVLEAHIDYEPSR